MGIFQSLSLQAYTFVEYVNIIKLPTTIKITTSHGEISSANASQLFTLKSIRSINTPSAGEIMNERLTTLTCPFFILFSILIHRISIIPIHCE